ncbi:hypothetical protein Tco_0631860 [Tanacetum coccineum]
MTKSKSFNKSPKQRALYCALMESILEDEDAMDEGVADKFKKMKQDNADKDEGPSTRSDGGLKRRKTAKTLNHLRRPREIVFEAGYTQEPHNQEQDMGNTDDQPKVKAAPKHDWFKELERPPTPDFDWNIYTRHIVILRRVEDLQLGVESYQKKLNIIKSETFRSDIFNITPYTTYSNPQGIIYEYKYKRHKLMGTDELYKFSDGTLTSIRTVLHDIASNLRMDYLPK